jgi:hypothetical protein
MTQRRTILTIQEICDDDCGIYRLGEIDTLVAPQISKYIENRGEFGYQQMLELAADIMVAAKQGIKDFRNEGSSGETYEAVEEIK